MILRVYDDLDKLLKKGKVTVIYGPRQVGKTTLISNFLSKTKLKYKLDNGDNASVSEVLSSRDLQKIQNYVAGYELVVIDEAQRIADVGLGLKIMVDNNPNLKVLITGSSTLSLSYKVGEPLVGRAFDYKLYPVSQKEMLARFNRFELEQEKEEFLIFGSYPAVIEAQTREEKIKILTNIANAHLFRDIIELERVSDKRILLDLLRLIALQLGGEVSLTELGSNLGIDRKTVARYLWLFEQSFVLYNLRGYSRNLRKEITKKSKYYFYDNGIRNAIISNFNALNLRDDVGKLWENFMVTERLKVQEYKPIWASNYFWRTWEGQEIDWVEERDGKLFGFEFKWTDKKTKPPKLWLETYENAEYKEINRENYLDFLT